MNRYKALADQNAIAQQTYDDSVTSYERAKSTYDRAAADLAMLQLQHQCLALL